jgi:hypothetical protein
MDLTAERAAVIDVCTSLKLSAFKVDARMIIKKKAAVSGSLKIVVV